MQIDDAFAVRDLRSARSIIRANPFATFVSDDLRVTRMPCLLDEENDGLTILSHVARADPFARSLGRPLVAIFQGPHGYVSASWYASDTIPTWNHVTLHLRGVPRLYEDALPVLERTVNHFEQAVERPWSLDRMGQEAHEMAEKVIAFRLPADAWHAEAKLSQDKPRNEWERVLSGLERPGTYNNPGLAEAMRSSPTRSAARPRARSQPRLGP